MRNGGNRYLESLSVFLDVIFALAFFRIFQFLPAFERTRWTTLSHGLLSLLASQPTTLTRVTFGLIIVAYYWYRKNALLSLVQAANGVFSMLAIASVAALAVFVYALEADPTYVGGPPTLLLQSTSLFCASFLAYVALRYAIHAGLTTTASNQAARQAARVDLSNPLTALVAIALSWSGLTIWTLSWFILMPLFRFLLGRGTRQFTGT